MSTLVQKIERFFSPTGPLAKYREFSYRPQQEAMACAVAEALEGQSHLIIEAPTGVGKTLAYLIPTMLYAKEAGRKAIVSTHTKNLQEQLARKDLPIVESLLGREVHAVVLKGRKNYLCNTRLQRVVESPGSLFNRDEQKEISQIYKWALKTDDGDIETLGFLPRLKVWEMVCSEPGTCSYSTCGTGCFYQRARERVGHAHVVIMNHALFFTLSTLQGAEDRFIYDDDFVILDEAHTLESAVGSGIGKKISRHQVLSSIHRLYNPRSRKGLWAKEKKSLKDLCRRADVLTNDFFDEVRQIVSALSANSRSDKGRSLRITTSQLVVNSLSEPLKKLQFEIHRMEESSAHPELASARRYLWEAELLIDEFLAQPDPYFTYWVELGNENVALCAGPSGVADWIGPKLFREQTSTIMTSATLSVNHSLDYFRQRVGANAVKGIILDYPFDFSRQMKLCVARDMPEPETEAYVSALPDWILQSVDRTKGSALVLFTSTAVMHSVAASLQEAFAQRGITLLVQSVDLQRHAILERFKEEISSVLFGLDSFWMGVDIPGEALKHVIITRLPFALPNHPLIEARLESIASRGGNSFLEYSLPEAVLKFRQGVGRLLRSPTDEGIVTILDSRIVAKRYGKIFMDSLPRCMVEIINHEGEIEYVSPEDW